MTHSISCRLRGGAMALALLVTAACNAAPGSSAARWDALTPIANLAQLDLLTPVWDNQVQSSLDVRLYLEPICQTAPCKAFVRDTLPYLTTLRNARVRIYDYPLSRVAESFMVAGIGRCVARQSPERYLAYLKEVSASDKITDELEMARISKLVSGQYDSDCLRDEIKKIKPLFENNNPLGLTSVPAMAINERLVYGSLSQAQVASLLESVR